MEKQQRILNAALQEFAENGYERASTNQIVKTAEIGKGMLFYYFKNKRELYEYLIDYSLDIILNDYLKRIKTDEPDFIERFKQASQVKMECYTEKPHVFNFLGNLMIGTETELSDKYLQKYTELQKLGFSVLYDNIDQSLFREDVEVNKAFQLIQWSIEGFQNQLLARLKGQNVVNIDFDPYWEEFYDYLSTLKTVFYVRK